MHNVAEKTENKLIGLTYSDMVGGDSSPFTPEDLSVKDFEALCIAFQGKFNNDASVGVAAMWAISAFIGNVSYRFLMPDHKFYDDSETPKQIVDALKGRQNIAHLVKFVVEPSDSDARLAALETQEQFRLLCSKISQLVLSRRQGRYINNHIKFQPENFVALYNSLQDPEVKLDYLIAFLETQSDDVTPEEASIYKNLSTSMRSAFLQELSGHPELCHKYWSEVIIKTIDFDQYSTSDEALEKHALAWFEQDFKSTKINEHVLATLYAELAKFSYRARNFSFMEDGRTARRDITRLMQTHQSASGKVHTFTEEEKRFTFFWYKKEHAHKIDNTIFLAHLAELLAKDPSLLELFVEKSSLNLLITIAESEKVLSNALTMCSPGVWIKMRKEYSDVGIRRAYKTILGLIEEKGVIDLAEAAELAAIMIGSQYADLEKYFQLHEVSVVTLAIIRHQNANPGFSDKLLKILNVADVKKLLEIANNHGEKMLLLIRGILVEALNLNNEFQEEFWEAIYGQISIASTTASSQDYIQKAKHCEYLKLVLQDAVELSTLTRQTDHLKIHALVEEIMRYSAAYNEQAVEIKRLSALIEEMKERTLLASELEAARLRSSTSSSAYQSSASTSNDELRAQVERLLAENQQLKSENEELKGGKGRG